MEQKKIILSASEVVAMPGPHFMVHGRSGSFLKYGQDVQEGCLLKGMRPGISEWGQEDEGSFGTLYTVTNEGISSKKIATEIGNYGRYYDNIYRAMTCGTELLVKPEETVDVLRIVEAAQESQDQKRRIKLK